MTERSTVPGDFVSSTLRDVALAYREQRFAGVAEHDAFHAAVAVYRDLHPDVEQDVARETVSKMIAIAVSMDPAWFWRGMPKR